MQRLKLHLLIGIYIENVSNDNHLISLAYILIKYSIENENINKFYKKYLSIRIQKCKNELKSIISSEIKISVNVGYKENFKHYKKRNVKKSTYFKYILFQCKVLKYYFDRNYEIENIFDDYNDFIQIKNENFFNTDFRKKKTLYDKNIIFIHEYIQLLLIKIHKKKIIII